MRVLMLSTNFHPVVGGAESYCRDLATGLAGRGHDVTVFTDGGASDGPSVQVEQGVTVIRERSYLDELSAVDASTWEQMAFGLLPLVAAAVDLRRVSVIHANSQDTALLGAVLRLQYGMPLVVTSHEVQRERGPGGEGRCRLVFGHLPVDAHIVVSGYYEQVARDFGAANLHRIPLGVDLNRFSPGDPSAARGQLGIADDDVVVTCVARFKQRKRLLELIDAAAAVAQVVPRIRLVLVGTTSSGSTAYAAQMRTQIVRRGFGGRVLVLESFGHDQIPTVLHATDVYAQPSQIEGFGMAALEAMACGVPVVASDTDGLREVVEPEMSGLLVSLDDPDGLVQAILRVLDNQPLRERLITGGLVRVRGFSVEQTVARTENLYRSLVGETALRSTVDAGTSGLVLARKGRVG